LFERYPNRFLLGSDTWINERWQSYGDIMAGYRAWLAQLPPKIAAQIANGNARGCSVPSVETQRHAVRRNRQSAN
jgi:hypothetical protein